MSTNFDRIAAWNAARYPREYSNKLTYALLIEEYTEYTEAVYKVDISKELADIVFVAIGAIWKLGYNDLPTRSLFQIDPDSLRDMIYKLPDMTSKIDRVILLINIVNRCKYILLNVAKKDHITAILEAVITSNETKSIDKTTDIHTKANGNGNRGENYVPAEPTIKEILNA